MTGNRQRAFDLARGIGRMFDAMNQASVTEFTVRNGRRADVLALDGKGLFTIVEVKTSVADFQSDAKWPDYLDFCDFYYFGVPEDFPASSSPTAMPRRSCVRHPNRRSTRRAARPRPSPSPSRRDDGCAS